MVHGTFQFVQARPSPREAGGDFHVHLGPERSADRSGGWQALAGLQLLHPEVLAACSAPRCTPAQVNAAVLAPWASGQPRVVLTSTTAGP